MVEIKLRQYQTALYSNRDVNTVKTKNWRGVAALLLAVGLAIAIVACTEQASEEKSAASLRWKEIERLPQAETTFLNQTDEQVVLYRNAEAKLAIYVDQGRIIAERADLVSNMEDGLQELFIMQGDQGVYYHNENYILIGVALTPDNPDSFAFGEWYSVDLSNSGEAPKAARLTESFVDPRAIISITQGNQPAFTLLAVQQEDDERYREYIFMPANPTLQMVHIESGAGGQEDYEAYLKQRPEKTTDILELEHSLPLIQQDGMTAGAYTDARGSIILTINPDGLTSSIRYANQSLDQMVWKKDANGAASLLGLFRHSGGSQTLSTIGQYGVMEGVAELLEEDWHMIGSRSFYKADDSSVSTVQFIESYPNSTILIQPSRKYLDLSRLKARFLNADRGLLAYMVGEEERNLSVYDILNQVDVEAGAPWQQPALDLMPSELAQSVPFWEPASEIPQGVYEAMLEQDTIREREIPIEVKTIIDKSQDPCLTCDPDSWTQLQVRVIGGIWHVLARESLYQIVPAGLIELGRLPIKTASTWGEGANLYTAQDYLYLDGYWYVTDTFADRVIKLDGEFNIKAEAKLPSPYQLNEDGNGDIAVVSLKGASTLSKDDLRVLIDSGSVSSIKLKIKDMNRAEWPNLSIYKDERSGNVWMANRGYVGLYIEKKKTFSARFIGYPDSGRTIIRVMPYEDEVLVLLDHKLERFSANGEWKSTIDFPETASADKVSCRAWPPGENSTQFAPETGQLFLVHGCGIINVDLNKGTSRLLFAQHYSAIGPLIYAEGQLVFSLNGQDSYASSNLDMQTMVTNELVMLNTADGSLQRYRLDGQWTTDRLTDKGEVLLWNGQASEQELSTAAIMWSALQLSK